MPKRISDIQRLITFAMTVTEAELTAALETLKAIQDSRFPKKARKAAERKSTKKSVASFDTDEYGQPFSS